MGNLPTIFEFYPYPLPKKVLLSVAEEATPISSVEIETPHESEREIEPALNLSREIDPVVLSSKNEGSLMQIIVAEYDIVSQTEPACMKAAQVESDMSFVEQVLMPAIEIESHVISPANEESVLMPTIEVEPDISPIDVQAAVILPTTEVTFSSPSTDIEQIVSTIEEDSPQSTESLNEINPLVPSSDTIRRKKFRAIRKFFSRFCCIRKLKDS